MQILKWSIALGLTVGGAAIAAGTVLWAMGPLGPFVAAGILVGCPSISRADLLSADFICYAHRSLVSLLAVLKPPSSQRLFRGAIV